MAMFFSSGYFNKNRELNYSMSVFIIEALLT